MRTPTGLLAAALALTGAVAFAAPQDAVREAERRLAELGYWTGPVDGVWDAASRAAWRAFRRIEELPDVAPTSGAGERALRRASPPLPVEPGAPHAEIDVERQVLFLVDAEGKVGRILPVSTGSGRSFRIEGTETRAITPLGHLSIYRKLSGWQTSPLGKMYSPSFVVGGVAIHGHASVPDRPSSHGCIRVPMFAARTLFDALPLEFPVLIHFGGSTDNDRYALDRTSPPRPALPAAPRLAAVSAPPSSPP